MPKMEYICPWNEVWAVNVYPSHHSQASKSTSTNPFLKKNKGSSPSGVNPIVKNCVFSPYNFSTWGPAHLLEWGFRASGPKKGKKEEKYWSCPPPENRKKKLPPKIAQK